MSEFKAKLDKQSKVTKWVLGIGAFAVAGVVSTFIVLTLMKVIIIAALVAAVTYGGPVVLERMKIAKLEAFKAMARKSPVETLQIEHIKAIEANKLKLEKIIKFGGTVKNFGDKVKGFKTKWPEEAPQFEEKFKNMDTLYRRRMQKWKEVDLALKNEEAEIEKGDDIWEMVLASADADEEAGTQEDMFISEMKKKTAWGTIRAGYNESVAQLDALLLEEVDISETPSVAITHQPPNVIDMGAAVEVSEKVQVSARNGRGV